MTIRGRPRPPRRLSIVVLTYNRQKLLLRCLDSLLRQTYPKDRLEILVCDDGSTDGTPTMMRDLAQREPGIVYARQIHRGIPANRNQGARRATGDVIAFVADDYVLAPDYAETVMSFLRNHPEAMIVRFRVVANEDHFGARLSHCFYDVSIQKRLGPVPDADGPILEQLLFFLRRMPPRPPRVTTEHTLEAAGAAAFRREVFGRVGLFDETLLRTEDSDLSERLRQNGIAIHYNPFHEIRHHYRRLPVDTLKKCYLTGFHRLRFHRKSSTSASFGERVRAGAKDKIRALLTAFWRARQAGSAGRFVAYLPFMLLFEGADRFGYFMGWLREVVLSPRTGGAKGSSGGGDPTRR